MNLTMKIWMAMVLLTSCVSVSAAEGGGPDQETLEQFVDRVEKNVRKRGEQIDRETIEARFQAMDANQDGVVTREERRARMNAAPKAEKTTAESEEVPDESTAEQVGAGDAGLTEAVAGINARFKNVEVELIEWPAELHEKLGKMRKVAYVTRPVEKIAGKLPLLINLHGGGQRWFDKNLQEQLALASKVGMLRGFDLAELSAKAMIVLEPNTEERWNPDSLDTMLDYVLENFPGIDKDRVYVMGYSAGGGGTWRWINASADRFAAAAPCGFSGGSDKDNAEKLAKLPIWGMAGSDDGRNPAGMRKMVKRLKAAGNENVKYTEIEGADHRAGGRAVFSSVELVEWMLGFKIQE